jgi:hypothetical protein
MSMIQHEGVDVLAWRREQLVDAGFDLVLADRLADDRAYDLHALIGLVDRGCPPHLAAQILAPLD